MNARAYSILKMAPPKSGLTALARKTIDNVSIRNKKQRIRNCALSGFIQLRIQHKFKLAAIFNMILLFNSYAVVRFKRIRLQRRLLRMQGLWNKVRNEYGDSGFKNNVRTTRATFMYPLETLKVDLQEETVAGVSIPPEIRLAVCFYRSGRGDYLNVISELTGLGTSTACEIIAEVSSAIVSHL